MTALEPAINGVGMVRAGAEVELAFGILRISEGVFAPEEKETAILGKLLDELAVLGETLTPLQG